MLYRSGDNLESGAINYINGANQVTLFSAYIKLTQLEKLNESKKINQIVVRWEIGDLCLGVSDIKLYDYCLENEIALYRNTRIHLKSIWDNHSSLFFGSANATGKGLGEKGVYNFELNGINEELSFEDRTYLNKIILESEYVDQELYEKIKKLVNSVEMPVMEYPSLPTPPPTDDYFLINQLPMTSSPEMLYNIYKGEKEDNLEMDCAAHDLELYRMAKGLSKTEFFNHLRNVFNHHPFIDTFKEVIKSSTNERNPERNGSMQFGAVRRWFSENTTTVPTPRSFELNSYVNILYVWICYFDGNYSWDIPGAHSQVIKYMG
jgi:hypothetical protein